MRVKASLLVLATFLALISFSPLALAQKKHVKNQPVPSLLENICPFEGCQYGTWTTNAPLSVYQNEGDSLPIFSLNPNESFTAIKGNVHVLSPGTIKITHSGSIQTSPSSSLVKTNISLQKGDLIYLLSPLGEGYYQAWFHGKQFEISDESWQQFNTISMTPHSSLHATLLHSPQTQWWVAIKTQDGKLGWLHILDSDQLTGADALE